MCGVYILLLLYSEMKQTKYVFVCVAPKAARKTRGELAKMVDADYYGYRDEDDGIIIPLESEREKEGQQIAGYV